MFFVSKRSPEETSEYDYAGGDRQGGVSVSDGETDDYAVVAFDENNGNMEDGRKVKVRAEDSWKTDNGSYTSMENLILPQGKGVHLILPESVRKIQIDECTFKAITFPSTFTKEKQ